MPIMPLLLHFCGWCPRTRDTFVGLSIRRIIAFGSGRPIYGNYEYDLSQAQASLCWYSCRLELPTYNKRGTPCGPLLRRQWSVVCRGALGLHGKWKRKWKLLKLMENQMEKKMETTKVNGESNGKEHGNYYS